MGRLPDAWHCAGRQPPETSFTLFEAWSRLLAGLWITVDKAMSKGQGPAPSSHNNLQIYQRFRATVARSGFESHPLHRALFKFAKSSYTNLYG
jgi:hypothetical protein